MVSLDEDLPASVYERHFADQLSFAVPYGPFDFVHKTHPSHLARLFFELA